MTIVSKIVPHPVLYEEHVVGAEVGVVAVGQLLHQQVELEPARKHMNKVGKPSLKKSFFYGIFPKWPDPSPPHTFGTFESPFGTFESLFPKIFDKKFQKSLFHCF